MLNFDDVPDGTVIDTHCPGIKMATVLPGQTARGRVYARKSWDKNNATNVMSPPAPMVIPAFDDGSGFIEVVFETPVKKVAVDAPAASGWPG